MIYVCEIIGRVVVICCWLDTCNCILQKSNKILIFEFRYPRLNNRRFLGNGLATTLWQNCHAYKPGGRKNGLVLKSKSVYMYVKFVDYCFY